MKNNNIEEGSKAVELKNIGKLYPHSLHGLWSLEDISLTVKKGEIFGIIGRNGAGKTTLLNIIAGVTTPTRGEVHINGKVKGLFNLGVGFQDELTGKENIFLNGTILGATRKELENKLDSIIEFSELGGFIHMPLGTYSQGMRLRLGFSIIANLDFDIMVIDEILAVGDIIFQNKCFQRLMDFRRSGKTMIITNQNTDLIKRLCDRVILLDHARLLFEGDITEGVNKYLSLLNTEKFFIGAEQKNQVLFRDTKKWADNLSQWGQKLGSKEVVIERVKLLNRFGFHTDKIKAGDPLRVKVSFNAQDIVKNPHFGVAIFREDGVYCHGPNTAFDGYNIPQLKKGKNSFILDYPKLSLAPGNYRFSVAVWDKEETLPFDYHNGYYKLKVLGENRKNELVNLSLKPTPDKTTDHDYPDLNILGDKWGQSLEAPGIKLNSFKLLNQQREEKSTFITNEPMRVVFNFKIINEDENTYLWAGIYRSDGIYCQGTVYKINNIHNLEIFFPKLSLLPGSYRISFGVWSKAKRKFLMYCHGIHQFNMIFDRPDHGTVYLEHAWKTKL